MNDDFFEPGDHEPTLEELKAGIEQDIERHYEPAMLILDLMKDEAGNDGVFCKSLKRLALRSGMDFDGVFGCTVSLIVAGLVEYRQGVGYAIKDVRQ